MWWSMIGRVTSARDRPHHAPVSGSVSIIDTRTDGLLERGPSATPLGLVNTDLEQVNAQIDQFQFRHCLYGIG